MPASQAPSSGPAAAPTLRPSRLAAEVITSRLGGVSSASSVAAAGRYVWEVPPAAKQRIVSGTKPLTTGKAATATPVASEDTTIVTRGPNRPVALPPASVPRIEPIPYTVSATPAAAAL